MTHILYYNNKAFAYPTAESLKLAWLSLDDMINTRQEPHFIEASLKSHGVHQRNRYNVVLSMKAGGVLEVVAETTALKIAFFAAEYAECELKDSETDVYTVLPDGSYITLEQLRTRV